MEKNEGSAEKSSSEQDLRRGSPRRPSSSEGRGVENIPAGGPLSFSSSNPPEGRETRPPVRVAEEMITAISRTPRPRPTRFVLVPAKADSGKRVLIKPHSGKAQPPVRAGIRRDGEFVTVSNRKGKGQLRETPQRLPRCVTCGKVFRSWKALFGHLKSHPDREYRGAFPPPRASNGFKRLDLRQQREIVKSLIDAAAVVSAMLDPIEIAPQNYNQMGESSNAGASSERPPLPSTGAPTFDLNNPDENRRSVRKDGLLLDLNAPPPDSDEENPK